MKNNYSPSKREIFDFKHDFFAPMEESLKHFGDVDIWKKHEHFVPAINVSEKDDRYQVVAELPGLEKENIEVYAKDNRLIIKGEKKFVKEDENESFHHIERNYGQFYRAIPFQKEIDIENVSARYENGILNVEIKKRNSQKLSNRRVEIQ